MLKWLFRFYSLQHINTVWIHNEGFMMNNIFLQSCQTDALQFVLHHRDEIVFTVKWFSLIDGQSDTTTMPRSRPPHWRSFTHTLPSTETRPVGCEEDVGCRRVGGRLSARDEPEPTWVWEEFTALAFSHILCFWILKQAAMFSCRKRYRRPKQQQE